MIDKKKAVCILGGTGFVGGHLAMELSRQGYRVRIPSRHPERFRHLEVLPGVSLHAHNIFESNELRALIKGAHIVINLVGVLNEIRHGRFDEVNAALPSKIIQACQAQGVYRLIHFSAMNADASLGASRYLRSKGDGEKTVLSYSREMDVTVFCPNVIFGLGDHFFNRFALLLKTLPLCLPLAGATARFSPVYVGDVVESVVRSIADKRCYGERYELCGPHNYRLKELAEYAARVCGIKKKIVEMSMGTATILALFLERLPGALLTRDNLRSLNQDCLCKAPFPEVFGITPSSIESIVPSYLNDEHNKTFYDRLRIVAGR